MTAFVFAILIVAQLSNYIASHYYEIALIFFALGLAVIALNALNALRSNIEYARLVRRIG